MRDVALCDSVTHFRNTVVPFGVFAAPVSLSPMVAQVVQMLKLGEVWALAGWTLPRVREGAGLGLEACSWNKPFGRGSGSWQLVCDYVCVHVSACIRLCPRAANVCAAHVHAHRTHVNL